MIDNPEPESPYIPLSECEDRRVYEIRGRNFFLGVYRADSKGFIGIREKLGNRYLSEEYHRDASTHHGTATPLVVLDVMLPPEIALETSLPAICGVCQQQRPEPVLTQFNEVRDASYRLVPGRSGWTHAPGTIHDGHRVEPVSRSNDALFAWLEPLAVADPINRSREVEDT